MPRTKRDNLKRQAGHTLNNIVLAQEHMAVLWSAFRDVHPEFGQLAEAILDTLTMALDLTESFAKHAWGYFPDDYQKWRDVPEDREFALDVLRGESAEDPDSE